MKKLISVLLILGMLLGVGCAEKDMFQALKYQEVYAELEGYTQKLMETMWAMLDIMNGQIDTGMELTDAEIDLYFKYAIAIMHMADVRDAQGKLWIAVTGYTDDLLTASSSMNEIFLSTITTHYEAWKTGSMDSIIYSTLESISKTVEMQVYPERAAEIYGK